MDEPTLRTVLQHGLVVIPARSAKREYHEVIDANGHLYGRGNSPETGDRSGRRQAKAARCAAFERGMISCDGFIDLSWVVYQAGGE